MIDLPSMIAKPSAPTFSIDDRGAGQFEHDWWYYAKKRFQLYPGIRKFHCGPWLQEYYAGLSSRQGPVRRGVNAITWAGFHMWLPFRARSISRKYGLGSDWERKALAIARTHFLDPNDIALFRIENGDQAGQYLRRFEHASINRAINPRNWKPNCDLGNKLKFHNLCQEHGLPHPEIHAVGDRDHLTIYSVADDGPLVIKPTGGEGGRGVSLMEFSSNGSPDRRSEFERQVRAALAGCRGHFMVQRKLCAHGALRPLAGTALLAARLVTMLDEQNCPELCVAVLRFPPVADALVDNIKSGGMMAPINISTGRLGAGCIGRGVGEAGQHPVSGVTIEGLQVPHWDDAVSLVLRAHGAAFADYNLIGWDVAITEEGPYLLEGNGKPCAIVSQRAPRTGLGGQRMGELIAWHLAAPNRRTNL